MERTAEVARNNTPFHNYNEVVTVGELCVMLAICKRTAYKLLGSGEIPSIRVGKGIRIFKSEILDYLSRTM